MAPVTRQTEAAILPPRPGGLRRVRPNLVSEARLDSSATNHWRLIVSLRPASLERSEQ